MKSTSKNPKVLGFEYQHGIDRRDCDCCMLMNARKNPFNRFAQTRSSRPGGRIFSDIKGPLPPTADGFRYIVCFVDDATRRARVFLMKTKDQMAVKLEEFVNECLAMGMAHN